MTTEAADRGTVQAMVGRAADGGGGLVNGLDAIDVLFDDVVLRFHAREDAMAFVAARFPVRAAAESSGPGAVPLAGPDAVVRLRLPARPSELDGRDGRRIGSSAGALRYRGLPGLPGLTITVADGVPPRFEIEHARSSARRVYKRVVAGVDRTAELETVTAYALLYPALLASERRGRYPLHASAVAGDGRAVLLLGLPGAGKSTISAALAGRGFAALSDNLVTVGEAGVWPVPEPAKLDAHSRLLAGVPDAGAEAATYGRSARRLTPPPGPLPVAAVVLLQPGEVTRLVSPARLTAGEVLDLNTLAFELHAYHHVRAFARLALGPAPGPGEEATMAALLRSVPVATLVVGRDDVAGACDAIIALAAC
jgi:hypothetical protein